MAADAQDVIFKALIKAGLQLEDGDLQKIQSKLSALGASLNEESLRNLAAQAKEVSKLNGQLKNDAKRLEQAATRGGDPKSLTAKQKADLTAAFNRVKTYQDQLNKLHKELNARSKDIGQPLFNQLKSLEAPMARLGAVVRNVKPLIDGITSSFQDNVAAARKAEREAEKAAKRREALALREQTLNRARQVEAKKNPQGRELFLRNQQSGFRTLASSADAKKALQFANVELKARREVETLLRDRFGVRSKEFKEAAKEADKAASAVNRLTNRVQELGEVERLRKKDKLKAETLVRTEAAVNESRQVRARRERQGRRGLTALGGIDRPVQDINELANARKIHRFVTGELGDLNRLQRAQAAAFGESSQQAKAAAREAQRYANFLANLDEQIVRLQQRTEDQTKAERAQQRVRDSEEKRRVTGIAQQRGRRAFEGAAGDFASIGNVKDVRAALRFAKSELSQLQVQQKETGKVFKEGSEEYRKATAEVDRYAQAVAALQARLDNMTERAKKVVGSRARSAVGSSVYDQGRQIYRETRLVEGGLQGLGADEAKKAQQYVRARLAEVRQRGKELARLYGDNSREAQAAGNAARQYAADLDFLREASQGAAGGTNLVTAALRSFVKYAVIYQVLYSLAAAFTALARAVVELQTELLDIQAVTGATDQQMGTLSQTVLAVAKNSKFSLLELTKAAKVLAQAGVAVEEMNSTLRATADFAAATGSNLEVAADLLSTTRSVFKELSDDVIANQLAKAINISKLTAEDLKTILSLGAQTAKSFNLTSEQFLAAVATLRNAGLKASTVATGLRQGMLEIFTPDATLVKALQARYRAMGENMGAEAVRARFFAFTKGRAPLLAALSELRRLGFNDEGQETLSRAFDIRSSNAIKAMIANLEELAANESRVTFGRGAAEGATVTINGLNASFTRLMSTIQGFAFDRSEGILGFFTAVIQNVDQAIQAVDRWDKQQRERGGVALTGPQSLFGSSDSAFNPFAVPRDLLVNFAKGLMPDTAEKAGDRALAGGQRLDADFAKFEEFEKAANAWDVSKGQLGEAVGQSAEAIVTASRSADDLRAGIASVFGQGLNDQADALAEVAKSYASLTYTQRKVRLEELKKQFPQLAKLTNTQLDRALFGISELNSEVNGALTGFAAELNQKLVKANETVRKLGDDQPTSAGEIEAVVFRNIVARDAELQAVLNGSSTHAVDMQLGIMQQAMQALSEELRVRGGLDPMGDLAKRQAGVFIDRVKQISLTTNPATADADIRAAVTELMARFKDLDQATVSRLEKLQGILFDAANDVNASPLLRRLLVTSVEEIQKGKDAKTQGIVKQTNERVSTNQELIRNTLRNPKFVEYLDTLPFGAVGLQRTKAMAGANSEGVPLADVLGNTLVYKETLKHVDAFNEVLDNKIKVEEEHTKETKRRYALEDKASQATQAYDDARTNKQFGASRAALNTMIDAEIAVERERLDEATRRRTQGFSQTDIDQNKDAIEKELRAKQRISELEEKRAKELEKISREEAQVNRRRREGQLRGEQKRLKQVLDNATSATPQAVIDDAITQLDATNAELLQVFKERKDLEGSLNDLSEAEIEERQRFLRPFRETAEYLEGIFNRERDAREYLLEDLDTDISTGNSLRDARLEDAGLIPGDRPTRRAFLEDRKAILQELLGRADDSLAFAGSEVERLEKAHKANPDDNEVAKSLRLARDYQRELVASTKEWQHELGVTGLELERVNHTWTSGLRRALDTDIIQQSLEQSENSLEHFGEVINDQVIGAIEGIGDAFADAFIEGEDFFQSMDKLFSQLGRDALRTVIKTLSNEALSNLGGMLFGSKKDGNEGLLPMLGRVITGGGAKTETGNANNPAEPVGLLEKVTGAMFGVAKPDQPAEDKCLADQCEGLKTLADGPGLAEVAQTEGKGFFATVTGWFGELVDGVGGGFGGVLKGLVSILGLAGGGAAKVGSGIGVLSLLGGIAGAFSKTPSAAYKGAYGFAGGGIIRGPGSGTSDSIGAYVAGPGGRRQPLRLSNGEAILTAKATQALGADFIHAINSGRALQARNGAVMADQVALSRATAFAPATSSTTVNETRNVAVQVSPAQMRMRLGDWLDQHVVGEMARR